MKQLQSALTRLRGHRLRGLIYALVAVLAVALLAAGLTGLELLPGEPEAFGFVFQSLEMPESGIQIDQDLIKIFRIVYLIGLILLPFWLVYVIINPQARKRFIRDLIMFGSLMLMIMMLASYFNDRMQEVEGEDQFGDFGGMPEAPFGELSGDEYGGEPPVSMMWVASILVGLFLAGFLAVVIWIVWRSRRREESAMDRIAEEVKTALDDLQAGGDFRNIVIRCYADMVQALRQERGVHRNTYLTPREFEDTLLSLGLPTDPVQQLTRLFETVRYGHKPVTQREELVARDSLTAILDACRSSG